MSTTDFFKNARALNRLHQGPLGIHIDDFASLLRGQGYAKGSAVGMLRIVADFSHWLAIHHLDAHDVDSTRIRRFLARRKRTRGVGRSDRGALRKLLVFLHAKGVVTLNIEEVPKSQIEQLKEEFGRYLVQGRGLSPATRRIYLPVISHFLTERFADGTCPLEALAAADIIGFVARHARRQSHSKAQLLVTALRTFLRYLLHNGKIATDLAACVPTVAKWSHAELPKFLTPDQVNQVLNHCDRKTDAGRRDYAILLLLARLGLRAGEVAALTLNQINWEQGYMTIRAKGGRWTQLPLLADVGEAIAQYLISGHATCNDRHVFIRTHAPRRGFATSTAISGLVKRAFVRAGLALPCNGAHLLRHSLATQMLRQGGSLFDIGQVLRHRQLDTTRIYAKVDLCALRTLVLPWPGENQ